jgi:hypothetical protein
MQKENPPRATTDLLLLLLSLPTSHQNRPKSPTNHLRSITLPPRLQASLHTNLHNAPNRNTVHVPSLHDLVPAMLPLPRATLNKLHPKSLLILLPLPSLHMYLKNKAMDLLLHLNQSTDLLGQAMDPDHLPDNPDLITGLQDLLTNSRLHS